MSDSAKWYVVHTYSGYENTVKATIEKHVENRNILPKSRRSVFPILKPTAPG